MTTRNPTRQEALELLRQYITSETLLNHAYAVEAVMRYMARSRGQDEEKWGVVGLVHDIDYERFPDQHCTKAREILEQKGWPGEYVRAVVSHGYGLCSDVQPQTEMEKALYAIDELTGLVSACALVRPSRSVMDLTPGSVKKKWKSSGFAAGVDRTVIARGAEMLGVPLDKLIEDTIMGMREVAAAIGLAGLDAGGTP